MGNYFSIIYICYNLNNYRTNANEDINRDTQATPELPSESLLTTDRNKLLKESNKETKATKAIQATKEIKQLKQSRNNERTIESNPQVKEESEEALNTVRINSEISDTDYIMKTTNFTYIILVYKKSLLF